MSWSLSPQVTVCILANHENHLHVSPGLSHCSIWPQYFNLFHQHLPSDLWLHPKSQLVHLCRTHNQRPQVNYNFWILNSHSTTHPDLAPTVLKPGQTQDLATRGILRRLSCPPGRRGQRLTSQDEKEPRPTCRALCFVQHGDYKSNRPTTHTHSHLIERKLGTFPCLLSLDLSSSLQQSDGPVVIISTL